MKIKNLSTLCFLVLSLLCFFTVEVFAFGVEEYVSVDPPPTVAVDNQKSEERPDEYLVDCNDDIHLSIYATNLIENEGDYILPNTATAVYVKLIVANNYEYTVPVESFQPAVGIDPINGLEIYSSSLTLPVPFEDICQNKEGKGELDWDFSTTVAFETLLVDVNGDPYPYRYNDGADSGIFSCLVFCEECPEVNNDSKSCIPSDPYEGTIYIDCHACLLEHDETPIEGFISQSSNIEVHNNLMTVPSIGDSAYDFDNKISSKEILEAIVVSPNPFQDEVSIQLPNQNSQDIKINIFDSKGQTITQHVTIEEGQENVKIDSRSWEQGLYIIHVETSTEIKAYKMVKINK